LSRQLRISLELPTIVGGLEEVFRNEGCQAAGTERRLVSRLKRTGWIAAGCSGPAGLHVWTGPAGWLQWAGMAEADTGLKHWFDWNG
jgi:hypothetical protein